MIGARAPVAQWIERRPPEPKVAGSNPVGRASTTFSGSASANPWAYADGVSLTKRVTPALGLTRRGDLKTKLHAFDLGVDDILTVPFAPEELLARAIVITRRATGLEQPLIPTITLGEMEIDILGREVRTRDSVIHLSGIEQSLLYLLASRAGRVVSRDEILDAIWGTDFVAESNIVDRHIRSLRVKLQNDYRDPRFIATVPGRGYRFIPTFSNAGWAVEGDLGHRPRN